MSPWNISCYHLPHNLLLFRVGLCSFTNRVLVCRLHLISDKQSHNHISPSWVGSGESDTGTSPPLLIPFPLLSIIPQLMSVTFNPLKTKAIQSHDYSTTFLFIKKTVLCRSQLRCVVIRVLDKTSEITVSKDAYSVAQLVAALPYKAEGRGFDSRWGRCIFYWFNPSGITVALGSTQLLIEGVQGVSPGV